MYLQNRAGVKECQTLDMFVLYLSKVSAFDP